MSTPKKAVATRTFEVLDENGEALKEATVSIDAPKQKPGAQEWSSRYEVRCLSIDRSFCGALGVDGVQALDFAVNLLGSVLPGTEEAESGRLRWPGGAYFRSAFLRVHFAPEEGVLGELGAPLATRTTEEVKDFYGHRGPMTIALGYPRQAPSGLWFCPYRLTGLELDCLRWVSGVDSMHAIQSALFVVHGFGTYNAELFQRHELWEGGETFGFPIVPNDSKR